MQHSSSTTKADSPNAQLWCNKTSSVSSTDVQVATAKELYIDPCACVYKVWSKVVRYDIGTWCVNQDRFGISRGTLENGAVQLEIEIIDLRKNKHQSSLAKRLIQQTTRYTFTALG